VCDSPWLDLGTDGSCENHDREYEDGEEMEEFHCNELVVILKLRERGVQRKDDATDWDDSIFGKRTSSCRFIGAEPLDILRAGLWPCLIDA
jgi:hypothetical protein